MWVPHIYPAQSPQHTLEFSRRVLKYLYRCTNVAQGCAPQQYLKRMDQDGLKEVVKQGLVYFEREERNLHMLLFPEVLDQVIHRLLST